MKLGLVFLVIWLAEPVHGSGSTCVAPTVEAGATARITCTFDTDVSGLQFMVRRKRSVGVEIVLDCYQLGDKPHCDMSSGVRYDLKPGMVQTLYIDNISKHFAGNYVCEMETTSEDECKPCHLNVSEPAKSLAYNIQAPTEMSDKPQHESSPRREDPVPVPLVVGVSVAVAAVVAVTAATLIVVFRRRKQQKHGEKEQMKDDKGRKEDKVPTINVVNEDEDMQSPSSSSSSASSTLSNASETKSLITKEPAHPITV